MTIIHITTAELGTQPVPVSGTITATYWQGSQPAISIDGDSVIIAKTTEVEPGVIEMTPTGLDRCVKWVIQTDSGKLTRFTSIPDSEEPVDFEDLETVNPYAYTPEQPLTLLEYVHLVKEGPQGIRGPQGDQGIPGEATPLFQALVAQATLDATAAETARSGAESASGTAQSAATSAGTAQVAAATNAATALSARTGAETAYAGAEVERTGAETARTGAELARTGAEAARDLALAGQFAGTAITSAGIDANTLMTPGVYNFRANAASNSINTPRIVPGVMEVFKLPEGILQRFTPWRVAVPHTKGHYTRQSNTAGSIWTPWEYVTSQRIDTSVGTRVMTWDDVNNREQMIHGDTGWRRIASWGATNTGPTLSSSYAPGEATGYMDIRRAGWIVYVRLSQLRKLDNVNPNLFADYALPVGFRPDNNYVWGTHLSGVGMRTLSSGVIGRGYGGSVGEAAGLIAGQDFLTISMTTPDSWPATLPGTPV